MYTWRLPPFSNTHTHVSSAVWMLAYPESLIKNSKKDNSNENLAPLLKGLTNTYIVKSKPQQKSIIV